MYETAKWVSELPTLTVLVQDKKVTFMFGRQKLLVLQYSEVEQIFILLLLNSYVLFKKRS